MTRRSLSLTLGASAILAAIVAAVGATAQSKADDWQKEFDLAACTLRTSGRSPYFVLEPGYQTVFEGGGVRLQITVLDETKTIDGVQTRVVEEREWKSGQLHEVARNYFALCEQTKDVFYFGEDVDFYDNGKVVKHDGTWHVGVDGNKPGLMMPGAPKVKMRYYQEIAPKVAMDRAEIISMSETCKTPAGTFTACMKVKESSALDPLTVEYKYHAPGVGLVADADVRLVKYGFVRK